MERRESSSRANAPHLTELIDQLSIKRQEIIRRVLEHPRGYVLLRARAMESGGFIVYKAEWWPFDYKNWREYPILNVPFEKLDSHDGEILVN